MCCKLPEIKELDKPRQKVCQHCTMGVGCKIYESRPEVCRHFYCGYMAYDWIGDEWKPSKCRMVVVSEGENKRFAIHVDRDRKGAWKKEPYYSDIKQLSSEGIKNGFQVLVWDGNEITGILPNRDKYLGIVRADQHIITVLKPEGFNQVYDILVVEQNDPRVIRFREENKAP